MAEEGQNTFVGSVIFVYKFYYLCGTDIFHIPTRNLTFSLSCDRIFNIKAILVFILCAVVFFFNSYYYSQRPHQAPETGKSLSVK